ncbi:hypothetical protein ITP53_37990 [Nonomuraea sp. K274]|uniref:YtkA-like domain-containing protein n=1 Tax=Nonomuraea cypriaca TaxID=1187855 RepID=A0A931AI05_9ACTN|nr:hypothetical protein [Nonomuraea cypriaca]MBF8191394.1 hypothetical protein [Nonomuraea cypriaca]
MRRSVIAVAIVAVAVVLFVVGRSMAAQPVEVSSVGTRYAVTVLIDEPTTEGGAVEVRLDSGDADAVAVSAVMPEMGHATPEIAAREPAPGRFLAEGELFPMAGAWEVSIRLDGPAGEEVLVVKALITA